MIRRWAEIQLDAVILQSEAAALLTYVRLAQVMDAAREALNGASSFLFAVCVEVGFRWKPSRAAPRICP